MGDYMHCKYLGSDQYFFGSIMWLLCFKILTGAPKENLALVVSQLKSEYEFINTAHRYGMITQGMFISKKSDQPKMKGRAAEVRHLGPALLRVFTHFVELHPPGLDSWKVLYETVVAALEANNQMETILENNPGWRLEEPAYTEFKRASHGWACLFSDVSRQAAALELTLFDITIKLHYILHIAHFAKYVHPKLTWCFAGESFMKITKQLLASCTRANKSWNATLKAMDKYQKAIDLEFGGIGNHISGDDWMV
jgi:hypothetical protein